MWVKKGGGGRGGGGAKPNLRRRLITLRVLCVVGQPRINLSVHLSVVSARTRTHICRVCFVIIRIIMVVMGGHLRRHMALSKAAI